MAGFETGAGIVGVIGLTVQITQVVVKFGIDWKDAPNNVKTFMAELGSLKTVLSETNTNIIINPDFEAAFQNRPSSLLSQLGPSAPSTTSTKVMIERCHKELESLLKELEKSSRGHRLGWERFKTAFLAKDTREAVENLCRQCQTLNNMLSIDTAALVATTYNAVKEARKEQQEWRQADGNQIILDWLTPIDYASQQSDTIARRQEGTGQWLLDSNEFHTWLEADKQTLFCPGIPGAGKTILTSIVVKELSTRFFNDRSVGIAYLYCNFRRQHEQKPEDLIASLLKQLAQQTPSVTECVRALRNQHQEKRIRPSLDEFSKTLHSVVGTYSKLYIIIDALDECQLSDGYRSKFLSNIFGLQAQARVNLFVTSRPISDIVKQFSGYPSREILASDDDIKAYLNGHMSQLLPFISSKPNLQEEIKLEIVRAVQGMFLLAQLYLRSLKDKTTPKKIRATLKQLQKQIPPFSEDKKVELLSLAYADAMERINMQTEGLRQLANNVLSWITYAKRPLTTTELQHALAVETGEPELDEENLPQVEDMASVCAGLVTIDEESDIIRLVHYTTQEYFEGTRNDWFPDAETDITNTCATYLSFDTFRCGFCPTDEEFELRLRANPFYDYAAQYWGHHARSLSTVTQPILSFLGSDANIVSSCQAMMVHRSWGKGYSQGVPNKISAVHAVACLGIKEAMKALLKQGLISDSQDSQYRTPLSYAAEKGHETVVQLLLEKGAAIDSKDNNGRTPLSWAAENGHDTVVRLLLEKGAAIESRSSYGQTPLIWAAEKGHDTVVQLLLEKGATIESKDNYGQTPLSWAAENGHDTVVRLLLETGAPIESKNNNGETPLWYAVANGHNTVVQLLLEKGAAIDSKDNYGQTPLSWAVGNGNNTVVQLLFEKGAAIDSKDNDGLTPLSLAAWNGHNTVVQLLLEKGAAIESKDNYGQTPLWWAAKNGHDTVVQLLLEKGAAIESKDNYGQTPLWWAAKNGHNTVVQLLLEKGAAIESKDNYGQTPLWWAAKNGHDTVVQLLLETGAAIESKGNSGQTPPQEPDAIVLN